MLPAMALIVMTLLAFTIPAVFAQGIGESPIDEVLGNVAPAVSSAFVIAFLTSMLGYLRNTPPEDFDLVKFLSTLVLSILIGALTIATGWDYNTIVAWCANAGLTIWIYWSVKAIAVKLKWAAREEEKPG